MADINNNTMQPNTGFIQTNKKQLFWLIVSLYILFTFISNEFIISEEHYYRSFSEQLSTSQIHYFFNFREKWAWVGYVLSPLMILIKLALVAMVLKIGAVLSNLKISYKQFFAVAVLAETVFVIAMAIKTVWLYFNSADVGLEYIQYFYPLSAINLVDISKIATWSIYAIQILNLFELLYWFVLAYLLMDLLQRKFWSSFEFVINTYVFGLLFWVVFVVFISLNFS